MPIMYFANEVSLEPVLSWWAREMATHVPPRKPYPTDGRVDEWAIVAPYLSLRTTEAPQRLDDALDRANGSATH